MKKTEIKQAGKYPLFPSPSVQSAKLEDTNQTILKKLDKIESSLQKLRWQTALAIQWDPKVALQMLNQTLQNLRSNLELNHDMVSLVKKAMKENLITQNYKDFCDFWLETLGYHPFLD